MVDSTKRRLVRAPDVASQFGFPTPEALAQAVRRGEFVRPVKTGKRSIAWVESELQAWLEARIAERDREQRAA